MIKTELFELDRQLRGDLEGGLCGVDEAGRGPLAGPVCCAAIVLHPEAVYDGLDDSKKLTERARERLYDDITASCLDWKAVLIDNAEIDRLNILAATMLGMKLAVEGLKNAPALALIDGNRAPELGCAARTLVKGDSLSASIAAASVIAKVTRDRYMLELDRQYPQYQFARHKGYPTKLHYRLLEEYGPSPVHRLTFLKRFFKNA